MSDYSIKATIDADDSGFQSTFENVEKSLSKWGVDFDKLYEKGEEFFKGFGVDIGTMAEKVGMAGPEFSALVIAVGAVGEKLDELGKEFDEVNETIVKSTGESGDALAGLTSDFQDLLASGTEASIGDLSKAFAELHTKMGLSGDELKEESKQFAEFADVTGQTVTASVESITAVMKKWDIETEKTPDLLNQITKAAQLSGTSAAKLTEDVKGSATQLQAMGLSLTDSIAMFASFEKSGVDTSKVMSGLNKALSTWAAAGKDAKTELNKTFDAVKNAKSPTDALKVSVAAFGSKAGPELYKALTSGSSGIASFKDALLSSGTTIEDTGKAAETLEDKMAILSNTIKAEFAPLGTSFNDLEKMVVDALTEIAQKVYPIIHPIVQVVQAVFDSVYSIFKDALALIDALWNNNATIQTIIKAVQSAATYIIAAVKSAGTVISDLIKTVTDIVNGDWSSAWTHFQLAVLTAVKSALDSMSSLINGYIDAINTIIKAIYTLPQEVSSMGASVINAIKSLFTTLGTMWNTFVEDIKSGKLASVAKDMAAQVGNYFTSAFTNAKNGIPQLAHVSLADATGLNKNIAALQDSLVNKAKQTTSDLGKESEKTTEAAKAQAVKANKYTDDELTHTLSALTEEKTETIKSIEERGDSREDLVDAMEAADAKYLAAYKTSLAAQEKAEADAEDKSSDSVEQKAANKAAIKEHYETLYSDKVTELTKSNAATVEAYDDKQEKSAEELAKNKEDFEKDLVSKLAEDHKATLQDALDAIDKEEKAEEEKATALGEDEATIAEIHEYYEKKKRKVTEDSNTEQIKDYASVAEAGVSAFQSIADAVLSGKDGMSGLVDTVSSVASSLLTLATNGISVTSVLTAIGSIASSVINYLNKLETEYESMLSDIQSWADDAESEAASNAESAAETALSNAETAMSDAESAADDLATAIEDAYSDAEDAAESAAETLKDILTNATKTDTTAAATALAAYYKKQVTDAADAVTEAEETLATAQAELVTANDGTLSSAIVSAKAALATATSTYNALEEKISATKAQMTTITKTITDLKGNWVSWIIASVGGVIGNLEDEYETLNDKLSELETQATTAYTNMTSAQTALTAATEAYSAAQSQANTDISSAELALTAAEKAYATASYVYSEVYADGVTSATADVQEAWASALKDAVNTYGEASDEVEAINEYYKELIWEALYPVAAALADNNAELKTNKELWTDSSNVLTAYETELSNLASAASDFYDSLGSVGTELASSFTDSLVDGLDSDDALADLEDYIKKLVVESYIYTDSMRAKIAAIGQAIATAIADGYTDSDTLTALKAELASVYSTLSTETASATAIVDELFGTTSDDADDSTDSTETATEAIADYITEIKAAVTASQNLDTQLESVYKSAESFAESMESIGSDIADSLISGLEDGLDESDWLDDMKDYIYKLVIQTAVYTDSLKTKIAEIGTEIADAIASGMTEDSVASIKAELAALYESASSAISSASSILDSVFGTTTTTSDDDTTSYSSGVLETGYATGTDYASAGWHTVGEAGPESIYIPQGSVVDSGDGSRMGMGGTTSNVTFAPVFNSPSVMDQASQLAALKSMQRKLAFTGVL